MRSRSGEASAAAPRIRLDKWLWAARFYKTRSLAKQAIDGGRVHVNGARAKASKDVQVGDTLALSRGSVSQTVVVEALSARRGSASIAAGLYAETAASLRARAERSEQRRMERAGMHAPQRRPDKRERRQLRALRGAGNDAGGSAE